MVNKIDNFTMKDISVQCKNGASKKLFFLILHKKPLIATISLVWFGLFV